MKNASDASLEPTAEQVRYAGVLEYGMRTGLTCLLVTYAIYVFGVLDPHVPLEQLSEHCTKDVNTYLADAEIETGWNWIAKLGCGDFVNFVGITILAGVTILCYLAILPLLLRKKDTIYVVLVLLEVAVLLVAASGFLDVGGH